MQVDKEYIKSMLETNDEWVIEAAKSIYSFSLPCEKTGGSSNTHDKFGFSRFDRPFMNECVNLILKGEKLDNSKMEILRKRLLKYSGQLVRITNALLEKEGNQNAHI